MVASTGMAAPLHTANENSILFISGIFVFTSKCTSLFLILLVIFCLAPPTHRWSFFIKKTNKFPLRTHACTRASSSRVFLYFPFLYFLFFIYFFFFWFFSFSFFLSFFCALHLALHLHYACIAFALHLH